jgi:hypothetical protein
VNSLTGLKTALTLNNVNNTSDLNKPISTLIQTALDLKANTSDVNTSLGLKLNKADTSTLSNRIDLKANTSDVTTSLGLKANTSDVNTSIGTKVDKVTGKELSTNDYTTVEKTKLAAITGTNTGDQNLSAYATTADVTSGLALKLNKADTSTLSNRIDLKANATDVATDLALKASLSELTSGLANKVDKVSGKNLSTNDYSTTEKTKLAAITGTNTGDQDLSLLATTASVVLKANATDVSTSLALKENISNKSTAVDLGGTTPSDILFPTQKAVKDYVTANNSGGGVADGGITTIKLADGAVSDAKINTVSGSKVIGNITGNAATATLATNATTAGNITATSNTTLTTLSNLTSVGTITSGVWSGTAVAVEKGGTGLISSGTNGQVLTSTGSGTLTWTTPSTTATKLTTARKINNVDFDGSGDITVTADAGTLTGTTIKSTVTGSSLTSVGTLTSATVNGKVIVGASTSASTSAVLEVNSTNQGFLPPRVYAAQRDAIVSPVAGLTIWCINCGEYGELNVYNGVAWVNMFGSSTSSVPSISIGQNYYGGKIAYILVSGDPGYDANTPHGLVAATVNQSTGIRWYNGSFTTTGVTGTAIGTGLANTNAIITSQGATATSYAAGLARAYAGGGYTDWYLPSKDELNKLYLNRIAIGGFTNYIYWSSTENDVNNAWNQYFYYGNQNFYNKNNSNYVRAIRAF